MGLSLYASKASPSVGGLVVSMHMGEVETSEAAMGVWGFGSNTCCVHNNGLEETLAMR